MPITTEIDTNNEFDWAERVTDESINAWGYAQKTVTTTFDDGHVEAIYSYKDQIRSIQVTDPTDILLFQTKLTSFTAEGILSSIETLDDGGQQSLQTYEDGILVSEVVTDENGTKPWSTITISYEDGKIERFEINYEDWLSRASADHLTEIEYDAGNTEDWLFIVRGRGGVRNWVSTYEDHGGLKKDTFENGIIVKSEEFDRGDIADWKDKYAVYNSTGVIDARFTFNDDGSSYIESFEQGVLTQTRLQDNGLDPIYRSVETLYDADGNITSRVTEYDRKSDKIEIFEAGILRSMNEQLGDGDTTRVVTTLYDEDGSITSRRSVYENGVEVTEEFENGIRTETFHGDNLHNGELPTDGGAKAWGSIHTVYDASGQVEHRETTYDNGQFKYEDFENGVRQFMSQTDGYRPWEAPTGDEGAYAWESIETYYDASGQVEHRETTYDNGQFKYEDFENGVRQFMSQTDGYRPWEAPTGDEGAYAWDSIDTYYDASGQVEHRETTYDNGQFKSEDFENGVRQFMSQTDGYRPWEAPTGDEGAYAWDSIDTYYDASGQVEHRETTYDNGQFKSESFENGIRQHMSQTDGYTPWEAPTGDEGAYAWDRIETYYDASGQVEHRETIYDNGVVKNEYYTDGARQETVKQDLEDSSNWDSIVFNYDENGKIAQATTLYDDGSSRNAQYEDSTLSLVVRMDTDDGMGGAYDWAAKMYAYAPDGTLEISATALDNGDEIYVFFDDGEKAARIENDVEGSDPWQFQVTEYAETGPVVTTYDTIDEVPDVYADYLEPMYAYGV